MMFVSRSAFDNIITRAHKRLAAVLGLVIQDVGRPPVTIEEGGEA